MSKIVKFPQRKPRAVKSRLPASIEPDTVRLREIVRVSDRALLGEEDGPHTPDAELLAICATALELLTRSEKIWKEASDRFWASSTITDADRARHTGAFKESSALKQRAKPLMRRVTKMRATTGAGIYAKALVVRSSRTGAEVLAKSLADDLIACTGLRATLWPAAPESAGSAQP